MLHLYFTATSHASHSNFTTSHVLYLYIYVASINFTTTSPLLHCCFTCTSQQLHSSITCTSLVLRYSCIWPSLQLFSNYRMVAILKTWVSSILIMFFSTFSLWHFSACLTIPLPLITFHVKCTIIIESNTLANGNNRMYIALLLSPSLKLSCSSSLFIFTSNYWGWRGVMAPTDLA